MTILKQMYILQGYSGAGKDSLAKILSKKLNIPILVSTTTRPMREGEVNGREYHFTNSNDFLDNIKDFLQIREYRVYDNSIWYYGLNKKELEGKEFGLMIADRKGYEDICKELGEDKVTSIFIDVDLETLKNRLKIRNDNELEIKRRLNDDTNRFKGYKTDYTIINYDLKEASEKLENIIVKDIGNY